MTTGSSVVPATLDGGDGVDVAVFGAPRAACRITPAGGGFVVADTRVSAGLSGGDGTDTLVAVERLRFTDQSIALDLDGHAGVVVKLIAATFGAAALSDAVTIGSGLALLDGGMAPDALAERWMSVAGAGTPAAVVARLWTNLVGQAPTAEQAQPFVDALLAGMPVGEFTLMAANAELNLAHIDLVGLARSGIEYVPAGP